MSSERWEGPMGIFDNTEDEAMRVHNEALGETEAVYACRVACQAFLRNTRGIKLKPGVMNSHGRHAWTAVLMALDAMERYESP